MKYFEATDGLAIAMADYRGKEDGVCYACCGGAARCLKEGWKTPTTFTVAATANYYELSLDCARLGNIGEMFLCMGMSDYDGERFSRDKIDYKKNNTKSFYLGMKKLASDLEEEGF
jgi:hypothetical protein